MHVNNKCRPDQNQNSCYAQMHAINFMVIPYARNLVWKDFKSG